MVAFNYQMRINADSNLVERILKGEFAGQG